MPTKGKPMFTRNRTKLALAAVLTVAGLAAAACGTSKTTSSAPSRAPTPAPSVTVSSAPNRAYGTILTDAKGMSLYFFDNDKAIKPQSACTGACPSMWPPLTASEGTTVGAGLDAAKLGQVVRADGLVQLTYNNWPLYRYSGDTAKGQTNGQGIMGIWHVAGVDGKPVTMAAAAIQPQSTGGGY